jgi:antitoxin component HigA of HigAB toxin-antitoxin module
MDSSTIRSEQEHIKALIEIEALMRSDLKYPEKDRLDRLVTMVVEWENEHHPMSPTG